MLTILCALTFVSLTGAQSPTPQDELIRRVSQGRHIQARELAHRLIREAAAPGSGAGIPYRAALYELLGTTETALENYGEAQQALEHGLKLCEQHQAALPELQVSLLVSLAETHSVRANVAEANRILQRALAVATSGLPPDHPRLASVLDGLGLLYAARGEISRAEQFVRRALAILERRLGPTHPDAAIEALTLASLLLTANRHTEAVPLIERSRNVLERTYGRSHPRTVFAGYNLGIAQLKSNPAGAETALRTTLADWRESQPERHTITARFLNALAAARQEQGDIAEALNLNNHALDILRDVVGPEHPVVVTAMYDRARLLLLGKRKKDAAALRKDADRIRLAKGDPEPGQHSIDIQALRAR